MSEESQKPNPEQFNVTGNAKKKKGLGPVKGLLLAILIIFLICVVGLLVRMVVEGDGDYFKPVKELFGMEEDEEETTSKKKDKRKSDKDEDDDEDEKEVKETKTSKGSTSSKSASKYALLSDDTEDEDVKHYRMSFDMEEIMGTVMDEMSELDEDVSSYGNSEIGSMMGMAMMILPEVSDMIAGEVYFDVYFEGNDIIQIVVGYDYGELLENVYDYLKETVGDELKEEGIKSADDLAEMLVKQFDEYLDEDTICKEIMNSSDEDTLATLKELGIKEKDIKDAIDINNAKGVIEFYITGTTKLKGLMSMVLGNEDFLDGLKDMEDELKVKIDEDNVIESMLKAINKSDECANYGIKFVEVN